MKKEINLSNVKFDGDNNKIIIVYYCFLVNHWKDLVIEQLNRIKKSGLYDKCDEFWVMVTQLDIPPEEFTELVKDYEKLKIVFHRNNGSEYPGINKVKEISEIYEDANILYFHTKGVTNIYENPKSESLIICEEKIKNIKGWRECLEYFLIDKWEDSLEKLKDNDCVGVTNHNGWYWGNFWWSKSSYIKRCIPVGYWGRWSYEAWLNDYVEGEKKFFQWYNFKFNPYFTFLEEEWYKDLKNNTNDKIILKSAKYGTGPFVIDEGYPDEYVCDLTVDMTDQINNELIKQNNEKFEFFCINYSNVDPSPEQNRNFCFIEYYKSSNIEKIYKIGLSQGTFLDFKP